MDKTVKCRVPFIAVVPKYRRRIVKNTILLVHDEHNECDPGDKVELAKSRPYSKRKHHIVKQILVKDPAAEFLQKNPQFKLSSRDLRQMREKAAADEQRYKTQAAFNVLQEATKLSESQRIAFEQQHQAATTSTTTTSTATTTLPKSKKKLLTEVLEDKIDDDNDDKDRNSKR